MQLVKDNEVQDAAVALKIEAVIRIGRIDHMVVPFQRQLSLTRTDECSRDSVINIRYEIRRNHFQVR